MLERIQVITEDGEAKFAVIPFAEYVEVRELLADEEKLADYLDYLHMQNVKRQAEGRHSLTEVRATLQVH
jgi:hypothetical protein